MGKFLFVIRLVITLAAIAWGITCVVYYNTIPNYSHLHACKYLFLFGAIGSFIIGLIFILDFSISMLNGTVIDAGGTVHIYSSLGGTLLIIGMVVLSFFALHTLNECNYIEKNIPDVSIEKMESSYYNNTSTKCVNIYYKINTKNLAITNFTIHVLVWDANNKCINYLTSRIEGTEYNENNPNDNVLLRYIFKANNEYTSISSFLDDESEFFNNIYSNTNYYRYEIRIVKCSGIVKKDDDFSFNFLTDDFGKYDDYGNWC